MFAQLGAWLTTFLTGYVAAVVGTLAAALTPVALIWLTVYIANYGYAVVRGEVQEPLSVFAWKMIKMAFILAFALSAGRYMSFVICTLRPAYSAASAASHTSVCQPIFS